jgi:hypothetical protein
MLLSTEILNFNARFTHLTEYFPANRERFGFTDIQMKLLAKYWEEWKVAYLKYTHPLYNGGLVVTRTINELYDKCYALVAMLKKRTVSPTEKLDEKDDAYLELNSNTKSVGKTPVTDYAPSLVCVEITPAFCKFFAMDPKHLSTKKKPAGANFIGIMVAYTLPDEPEPDDKDFKKLPPEKKTIFDVIIKDDKAKMWQYIKVYYISPTGEEGTPSKVMLVKL